MAEKQYFIEYTSLDEFLNHFATGKVASKYRIVVGEKNNVLEKARELVADNYIILSINEAKVCPNCGRAYTEYPAISRKDNKTEICPDCGVEEAIKAFDHWRN